MGNTCACIRSSGIVSGLGRAPPTSGVDRGSSSNNAHGRYEDWESLEQATRSGKVRSDVEDRIERSKAHWSQLTECELDLEDEEVAEENRQVFEELQSHSTWGQFFQTFGYDRRRLRAGELVMGEKFAEGGQAELFHAKVIWRNSKKNEEDSEKGHEWVVKVFKKGTRLRELQAQWPLGYLQWQTERKDSVRHCLPSTTRFDCEVYLGTLLQDGRFAFLMRKEHEDLRCRIDRAMLDIGIDHGPFSKDEAERIMFHVAQGMDWLHKHNILHRDLKASNVLVCVKDSKVYSKEADVYSYGMMCYEVLTGKLPFEGHRRNDYDMVIHGIRPGIPEYVDGWIKELLIRCWDVDCSKRPLFREIMGILSSNSTAVMRVQLDLQMYEDDKFRKYVERVLHQGLVVEPK